MSTDPVPCTTEAIRAAWPEILAAAARQSRLVSQALEHATPTVTAPGVVELQFGPDNAVFREGVARQLALVETILGASVGTAVAVTIAQPGSGEAGPASRPARVSKEGIREERLQQLRAADPALDAAADALDLELVDEG